MNIILEGRVGSHAYGLATPESDEDFLGIYAAPTEQFWTVNNKPQDTIVTKDPDRTMHEVEKYVRLAFSANPTALELLWLDDYTLQTTWGWELRQIRRAFITRDRVQSAYMGYAKSQMGRMRQPRDIDLVNKTRAAGGLPPETEGEQLARRAKNARHLARLLWQATVFDITGELPVKVPVPSYFVNAGLQAAQGDMTEVDVLWRNAETQFANGKSQLPLQQDVHAANMWLLRVRMASFAGGGLQ